MNDGTNQPKKGYELNEHERFTLMMLQLKQTDGALYDAISDLAKACSGSSAMANYLIALADFLRYETSKDASPSLRQKDPDLYSAALVVLARALTWPRLCAALGSLAAVSDEMVRRDAKRDRHRIRQRNASTGSDASTVNNVA